MEGHLGSGADTCRLGRTRGDHRLRKRLRMLIALAAIVLPSVASAQMKSEAPAPVGRCAAPQADAARTTPVNEPAAGVTTDVTPMPREMLSLNFSPFDARPLRHRRDLILQFADGGKIMLRHVFGVEAVVGVPIRLPDGTVISLCELLSAMPGEEDAGDLGKVPADKSPPSDFDQSVNRPSQRKIPQ